MDLTAKAFSYEKIKAIETSRLQCFLGMFLSINGVLVFLQIGKLGWVAAIAALVLIALGCRLISLAFFPLKVVEHSEP